MENNGKSKGVINNTRKALTNLSKRASLTQPELIKEAIAKMKTGNAYKRLLVQAYSRYARYYKIEWERPSYHVESQEIAVPTDEKINMLIATAKRPLSTKLQLSNETGIRPIALSWKSPQLRLSREIVNCSACCPSSGRRWEVFMPKERLYTWDQEKNHNYSR